MGLVGSFFSGVGSFLGGTLAIVLYALWGLGGLYWLWMSIQIGSFLMFVVGIFPPSTIFVAAPVGAYSLLFGVPDWVLRVFG